MKKFGLTFECNQNWEDLKPTSCGRYCAVCKKEVFDLTNKSKKDIITILEKNDGLVCGKFDTATVHPELFTINRPSPRFLKMTFLFSFLYLSSANSDGMQREAAPIELSEQLSESTTKTIISEDKVELEKSASRPIRIFQTKKKYYYLTWRFPFIYGVEKTPRKMGNVRFL